jgi:iron only hydrogenase large subunit-like protein
MDASRGYVDDFDSLMADLKSDSAISAIVAPAAAAHFPNKYLKLNGWLKSLGIKKIFDVSFGAELTVK